MAAFAITALAVADACSGKTLAVATDSAPPVVVDGAVGASPDAFAGVPDGNVIEDAGADADATIPCGAATEPVSDGGGCYIFSRCTFCTNAFVYNCYGPAGMVRPDIAGCSYNGPVEEYDSWCCPASCIVNNTQPGWCPGNQRLYTCPLEDGGFVTTPKKQNCALTDASMPAPPGHFCCDP